MYYLQVEETNITQIYIRLSCKLPPKLFGVISWYVYYNHTLSLESYFLRITTYKSLKLNGNSYLWHLPSSYFPPNVFYSADICCLASCFSGNISIFSSRSWMTYFWECGFFRKLVRISLTSSLDNPSTQ